MFQDGIGFSLASSCCAESGRSEILAFGGKRREEGEGMREIRGGSAEIPLHLIYGNTVSPLARLAVSTRKAVQYEGEEPERGIEYSH